jgi:phosphatidylserine decarboxylase
MNQYDTDDTGRLSHLELTSMLDSLNSTLTRSTIAGFFTRFGKSPYHDELTFDEAVQCLETEVWHPEGEKRQVGVDGETSSGSVSTSASGSGGSGGGGNVSPPPSINAIAGGVKFNKARSWLKSPNSKLAVLPTPAVDDSFERVINVRNCPLCHRPRMNDKAVVDIITHLAVCARGG